MQAGRCPKHCNFGRFAEAIAVLSGWLLEGKLKSKEHIVDSLVSLAKVVIVILLVRSFALIFLKAKAPDSLQLLFSGGNQGLVS